MALQRLLRANRLPMVSEGVTFINGGPAGTTGNRTARARHVGADVSEVAPPFDLAGIPCVTAANLMFELLCVMATSTRP